MSETVIKAENLSKYYRLGQINNGMLFRDIQTWIARKLGKEDPHSQIGSVYDPNAEGFWALKDLNFEIKQGERVGIIGKNGAGKSTLLKILSQITAPTEGSLKIRGRIASLLEVGTGFHQEMTGRENIYLNGAILGMKKKEIDKKLDEIIAFSEIEQHIDTPVKRYSSGMYVRLAFAIAAHLDSDILIADEVLAVGDAAFQKKAIGKMNELSTGEGRTVLFVSHNMKQVKNLCSRGIVLEKGKKILDSDIVSAIDLYLGKRNIEKTEFLHYDFNHPTSRFNVLNLRSFSVLEDGVLSHSTVLHETSKKYTLLIEGELLEKKDNLVIFLSIFKDGENIYTTDMYESNDLTIESLQVGKFELYFDLPFSQLTSGEYIVSISAVLHYQGWIIENDENGVILNLIKTNRPSPVYEDNNHPFLGTSNRPGILSIPSKTWLIQK